MTFANELRKWRGVTGRGRKRRGEISQTEAAVMLGVPLRTLQDWEIGRHEPPDYVVNALRYRMTRCEKNAARPVASSNRKAIGTPSGNGRGEKRVTNGSKKTTNKK